MIEKLRDIVPTQAGIAAKAREVLDVSVPCLMRVEYLMVSAVNNFDKCATYSLILHLHLRPT